MLELAVLGVLQESPMHGYEVRKQLGLRLGGFRLFSYGSLYPALRRMTCAGLIVQQPEQPPEPVSWSPRTRRVYRITPEGRQRLAEMLAGPGPGCWADGSFGVHLAFFARTPAPARLRLLEGRRRTVEKRREDLRAALTGAGEQTNRYTQQLHRLGLDGCDRELSWLDELIQNERAEHPQRSGEHAGSPQD